MTTRRGFAWGIAGTVLSAAVVPVAGGAQGTLRLRVGASPVDVGGQVYYAVELGFFKQQGLDVEIVTTSNGPATAAAIVSGSLDIGSGNALSIAQAHDRGLMVEPALDKAVAGDGKVFAPIYDTIAKDFTDGGFFALADYVKTHLDAVRRFNAAMIEAAKWGNANRAASAKILEKYSGVPAGDMVHRVRYYERLDPATIQPLIDIAAKYGTLKASFPAANIIAPGL